MNVRPLRVRRTPTRPHPIAWPIDVQATRNSSSTRIGGVGPCGPRREYAVAAVSSSTCTYHATLSGESTSDMRTSVDTRTGKLTISDSGNSS